MKKLFVMVLAAIMTFVVGISLMACDAASVGISKVYVDENSKIIVEFSDGTTKDYGKAEIKGDVSTKTITNTIVNGDKHLIVVFSDGTTEDLGYIGVEIQPDPVKTIVKTSVNQDKHLIVEYSDNTSEDLGYVGVEVEPDPVKTITNTSVNEDKHFVVEYSDGTSEDLGYVGVEIHPDPVTTIVNTSVNQDKHLIVEYSDGTTEDMGYVGVEIQPTKITVTFVDYNDNIIATEETYVGLTIKTPADPVREDYIFSGWDKDLTNVTESTTVKATYTAKQGYVVTFLDYDDTVLKTETVISGKSATPPANPTRENYKFSGWDGSYTNITSNRTIRATYTVKGSYTVTFKDYNGLTLGTDTVQEGNSATAPITPTRDGYTFKGWNSSLNNITSNKTVVAEYTLISASNVFDIAYSLSGNTVTVTLSLAGNVCLAGFEGTLTFNGMTLTNATAKSNYVLINSNGNTITITYSNATNITKGETILTATLTKTADTGTATLNITDCFDQNFDTVSYKVIGQDIKLK